MKNVWKISPGFNAEVWERCHECKCISINWLDGLDFSKYSKEQILTELEESGEGKRGSASTIWSFVNEVRKGDIVVANNGLRGIVGIGIIKSGYLSPSNSKNPNRKQTFHRHVRRVDWVIDHEILLRDNLFNQQTLHRLTLEDVEALKTEYLKRYPELKAAIQKLFPGSLAPDDAGEDVDDFIPPDEDSRQTVERQIKARRGQKKFRNSQLSRFGSTCAVSGCQVVDLLEAAHISPYRGDVYNDDSNGLLLRSDIHTLFDLNLLAIDPVTKRVVLSKEIQGDEVYGKFANKALFSHPKLVIAKAALKAKFDAFARAERER